MRNREELFIPYGRRGNRDLGLRVDLRMVAFLGLVLVVLGLAGWLYLRQASEAVSLASEIRVLQEQREDLHRELIVLEGQVAMLGSFERVLQEGIAMGYTLRDASDTNQIYVSCEECRVVGLPLSTRAEAEPSPTEVREGFWQRVTAWFQTWLRPQEP